jgi:hypothetical protein
VKSIIDAAMEKLRGREKRKITQVAASTAEPKKVNGDKVVKDGDKDEKDEKVENAEKKEKVEKVENAEKKEKVEKVVTVDKEQKKVES